MHNFIYVYKLFIYKLHILYIYKSGGKQLYNVFMKNETVESVVE